MTLTDLLVWICFLLNSKGGAPFHCKGCDYTSADWGSPPDYLRDVPWKTVFKLGFSAASTEFCERL